MTQADPNAHDRSLKDRVVVVLGAASSPSQHLVRAMAEQGARVVMADLNMAAWHDLLMQLEEAGAEIQLVQTNLDSAASLAQLFEEVRSNFGIPDAVLLETPSFTSGPLLSHTEADWEAAVTRPLRRALLAARAFVPAMRQRGTGTLLALVMVEAEAAPAVMATAHAGLTSFMQALAREVGPKGVRAVALGLAPNTLPAEAAAAAVKLLAQSQGDGLVMAHSLADGESARLTPMTAFTAEERGRHLSEAVALSQQLASLLLDTDSEFDRLPVAVRPLARGVFKSKVGYRSQDVLRAVNKLTDQLQRMQASHSANDTEFQVDYPLLAALLERLLTYYQAIPSETARLTSDDAALSQVRRHMAEREALIQRFLRALDIVHA